MTSKPKLAPEPLRPEGPTFDALLGGRVRLAQPAQGYRAAIDPVFLAAAVAAKPGDRVLDVGAGVGAAALCLAARVPESRIAGIEAQRDLVRLAVRNALDSGMRIDFMAGDLKRAPARLAAGSFDHVMSNPPYLEAVRVNMPPQAGKRMATVESGMDLIGWLDFCLLMVRPKGTVTLIHRADRLDSLLEATKGRLGGVTIFPLWPGPASERGGGVKAAKRILVAGRKGVKTPMRLLPGLVLHGPGGIYTPEAEAVLRHGEGLNLGLNPDLGPDLNPDLNSDLNPGLNPDLGVDG